MGEFVRRHHARLAHEISHFGFPGLDEQPFPLLSNSLPRLADIVGTVARSHGLELRMARDYLRWQHSDNLRPRGTAIVYLMAILRVADYLQLQSDRAPLILLRLRNPQSPVSIQEWSKHSAVQYVSWDHRDPYAIHIEMGTSHSHSTHLQVVELLHGLQLEMDVSSAVISETYGHYPPLGNLRLAKTRANSNINDPALLSALPFVPEDTGFEADASILPLLVQPLYEDRPEIGVRELLQNALDAVRERIAADVDSGIGDHIPDILIHLKEDDDADGFSLVIEDRGIGMTAETLRAYFLRAGASYRMSPEPGFPI